MHFLGSIIVSLKEELETTELYVNIENIRFNNQILYKIIEDGNLNLEKVKIPPLILQPFVENAIWHGLSAKNGLKILTITVTETESNFIQISIKDNGIGRKKAEEIKKNKLHKKKSIGLELTKTRLELFTKNKGKNFKLDFFDLYINDFPAGTEVILKIPK